MNHTCCYEIFCLRVCKLQDMLRLTVLQANTLGQQSVPSFFAAFFSCCLQVMKGPPRSPWTKMTSAAILELREERELSLFSFVYFTCSVHVLDKRPNILSFSSSKRRSHSRPVRKAFLNSDTKFKLFTPHFGNFDPRAHVTSIINQTLLRGGNTSLKVWIVALWDCNKSILLTSTVPRDEEGKHRPRNTHPYKSLDQDSPRFGQRDWKEPSPTKKCLAVIYLTFLRFSVYHHRLLSKQQCCVKGSSTYAGNLQID